MDLTSKKPVLRTQERIMGVRESIRNLQTFLIKTLLLKPSTHGASMVGHFEHSVPFSFLAFWNFKILSHVPNPSNFLVVHSLSRPAVSSKLLILICQPSQTETHIKKIFMCSHIVGVAGGLGRWLW